LSFPAAVLPAFDAGRERHALYGYESANAKMLFQMRLLILGDIHANYPALKAIQNHVRNIRFDGIINTGDFTVYGTYPNETIDWFRKRKESSSILGNTDKRILRILKGKELKKPQKEEKRVMYFWTAQILHMENISYLKSLPKKNEMHDGSTRIGIFHGTFLKPNDSLMPAADKSHFKQLAHASPYQVHIMGHSHIPYYEFVDGVHFINPGSVGRMFDGDPRASFATLDISTDEISVAHFRVPYPVEEVIKDLKKHNLPEIYGKMFRTGRKLN